MPARRPPLPPLYTKTGSLLGKTWWVSKNLNRQIGLIPIFYHTNRPHNFQAQAAKIIRYSYSELQKSLQHDKQIHTLH